jgi:TonB-dependent receptor
LGTVGEVPGIEGEYSMGKFRARSQARYLLGASLLAITLPQPALAQVVTGPAPEARPSNPPDSALPPPPPPPGEGDNIVITGIRASLRESRDIKKNSQGVVDAITAEDMGKFPDTNLAESLQRITGVSIDRQNGEGSLVTVRGFGPEFNLVLLNGREMPTANLGNGDAAPSTRSFDFANIASEGVAAVEVYKSGRVTLPTGGIGSTINILTPRPLDRPGLRGSISAKGVLDTSRNDGNPITPEVSGIFSDTFADDRVGILVTGAWQKRKASVNQANVGWRDGYLGSENNWGSLPMAPDPRAANIVNRPGPTDVYEVQQNASYDINDIDRTRINGQAVLQFRPVDSLTGTIDFTYSQNTVKVRNSNVGVWFNFNNVSSEWTDGPVAGPIFYSEHFNRNENKDLSYSGSLTENRSTNKSLGGNLAWTGIPDVSLQLDAHHSTAVSKPNNKYGTNMSVGNAVFGIQDQTIDYTNDLPVISVTMYPDVDPLDPANIIPTGNAFRTAYVRDEINQGQFKGHWDTGLGFLDGIDFGVSYVENKARSAFGVIQHDTWGGAAPASALPDDLFHLITLPDKFKGISGSNDPAMLQSFYGFDFESEVALLDQINGICGGDNNCLAPFTTDRRLKERTWAPYLQANAKFELFNNPANLRAGVRYETTKVNAAALVPVPIGTRWVSFNEFGLIFGTESAFTQFDGKYHNWLPAVDFDMEPIHNVKLRASYSHTLTRADYASLQGGRELNQGFRIANGFANVGNPGLLPFKSKNIDLSAEWYYQRESYLSVGYFHKDVSNFISTGRTNITVPPLTNPASGPRYAAAIAALGANAPANEIRNYIFTHFPGPGVNITGTDTAGNITGDIFGLPEDNPLIFELTSPINSDQTAKIHGWEFNIQHSFWNTGFGAILNYTIVRGDAIYDNTQPASVTQFALTGLSDSANAVLFYDKNGIQARVAYNWRDEFLSGSGPNPFYVEPYGQVDASASWEFRKGVTAFVEGININGADRRGHRRHKNNVTFVQRGQARFAAGLRLNF